MAKHEIAIGKFAGTLREFCLALARGKSDQQLSLGSLTSVTTFDTEGLNVPICPADVDQNHVEASAEQLLKLQNDGRFTLDCLALYLRKEELGPDDLSLITAAVEDTLKMLMMGQAVFDFLEVCLKINNFQVELADHEKMIRGYELSSELEELAKILTLDPSFRYADKLRAALGLDIENVLGYREQTELIEQQAAALVSQLRDNGHPMKTLPNYTPACTGNVTLAAQIDEELSRNLEKINIVLSGYLPTVRRSIETDQHLSSLLTQLAAHEQSRPIRMSQKSLPEDNVVQVLKKFLATGHQHLEQVQQWELDYNKAQETVDWQGSKKQLLSATKGAHLARKVTAWKNDSNTLCIKHSDHDSSLVTELLDLGEKLGESASKIALDCEMERASHDSSQKEASDVSRALGQNINLAPPLPPTGGSYWRWEKRFNDYVDKIQSEALKVAALNESINKCSDVKQRDKAQSCIEHIRGFLEKMDLLRSSMGNTSALRLQSLTELKALPPASSYSTELGLIWNMENIFCRLKENSALDAVQDKSLLRLLAKKLQSKNYRKFVEQNLKLNYSPTEMLTAFRAFLADLIRADNYFLADVELERLQLGERKPPKNPPPPPTPNDNPDTRNNSQRFNPGRTRRNRFYNNRQNVGHNHGFQYQNKTNPPGYNATNESNRPNGRNSNFNPRTRGGGQFPKDIPASAAREAWAGATKL